MAVARIRVVPASDRPIMLLGIRAALANRPDLRVVGDATTLVGIAAFLAARPRTIALVDAHLFSGSGGVETLAGLEDLGLAGRWVLVGPQPPAVRVRFLLGAYSISYVSDCDSVDTLVTAIQVAAGGRSWRSPSVVTEAPPGSGVTDKWVTLSDREVEVLRQVAQGRTDAEIARTLGIKPRTVGFHLAEAESRLGTTSRVAAVVLAARLGLLGPE